MGKSNRSSVNGRRDNDDLSLPVELAKNEDAILEGSKNDATGGRTFKGQRGRAQSQNNEGSVRTKGSYTATDEENNGTTAADDNDASHRVNRAQASALGDGTAKPSQTKRSASRAGTASRRKRSNLGTEARIRSLFRLVLLFCGVLFLISAITLVFWSQVIGSNRSAEFNRTTEVRDPAFFTSEGHYTENNLRLNIMPIRFAGKSFPIVYSKDVTLERVTVGPGSVITNYFSISPRQVKRQTPEGVAASLCASKKIRQELIDMVDEYRLVYSSEGHKLYRLTLTSADCDEL